MSDKSALSLFSQPPTGDCGQKQLRPALVTEAELENPTSINGELDALVSQVALSANDAWKTRGRQHKALHAFMGHAYGLARRVRDDKPEFVRIMRNRGITTPKLGHLYYQVVQAFQPEEQRSDPDMKSEASRLKRAFIQAEALGYTATDFVRRIESKELVAGTSISGVNKLIKLAQLSRSPRTPETKVEAILGGHPEPCDFEASPIDLSSFITTILNKALPLRERQTAMNAAADAVEKAGILPKELRVRVSKSSGQETTSNPAAFLKKKDTD